MTVRIEKDIHTNAHRQVEVQDQLRRDYGVQVTGNIVGQDYHDQFVGAPMVDWTDKRLKRIIRLRLLGDVGYPWLDVSYCDGVLIDGTLCKVQLPFSQLPYSRNGKAMWRVIYEHGTRDKVYVNKLFSSADISTLR